MIPSNFTSQHLVPELPSVDFEKSNKFYITILPFEKDYASSEYMVMKKSATWLHFWKCIVLHICHYYSFYRQIKGIEKLYECCEMGNIVHPNSQLQTQFWGAKEFVIRDVYGNCVTLSENI